MTEKSRTTDELVGTSVESDGFIDAVLEVAKTSAAVDLRHPELTPRSDDRATEVAVDMIDGELLAAPAPEPVQATVDEDETVVDLRDGAPPVEGPVAKATSRSAAIAKAKQVKAKKSAPKPKPAEPKPVKAKPAKAEEPASNPEPAKPKPVKAKPAKAEEPPLKPKSAKPEPVKVEPAKAKPVEAKAPVPKPATLEPAHAEPSAPPASTEPEVAEPELAAPALRNASASGATPRRALVVDYRAAAEAPVRTKRRRRPIRRLRRAFREYSIRRASGSVRVPLRRRWRKARLRRMRARRSAATQAALLGQDPESVHVGESNFIGYAVAVLVIAAVVVAALLLFV